jgi:hypothetical protein
MELGSYFLFLQEQIKDIIIIYSEPTAPRESKDQSVELCEGFSRSQRLPLRMTDNEVLLNASEVLSHLRYKELMDSVDVETRGTIVSCDW